MREPGSGAGDFSLGPRVLIAWDDVPSTGLLGFGGRARRAMLLRMPEPRVEALVKALRDDFKDDFINTRSFRSTDDQIGRDFDRAENYLSLVGLIIVILGGIAVSSVTRVFILQKIRSIAVLKCLGARSGQIIAVYILQVMTLAGRQPAGVAMARAAIAAIPLMLASSTSILAQAHYGVSLSAALQGIGIGVLVSPRFPRCRCCGAFIKPSLLLRDESRQPRDWKDRRDGCRVAGARRAGRRGRPPRSRSASSSASVLRVWRHPASGRPRADRADRAAGQLAVVSLRTRCCTSRPGNQTRVILLAVGLGAFFIVGVRSLQGAC